MLVTRQASGTVSYSYATCTYIIQTALLSIRGAAQSLSEMLEMIEEHPTTLMTTGVSPRCDGDDTLMKENTTMDTQLLLLLKTLHDETLSNWTGSFDDPAFDYLNIPLVKVLY